MGPYRRMAGEKLVRGGTEAVDEADRCGGGVLMRAKFLWASVVCSLVTSCGDTPSPPLPPLLKGATGGGGGDFLCNPLPNDMRGKMSGETPETVAQSPEIVARLRKSFPTGSPASALESTLVNQGFKLEACSSQNVKRATFSQTGGNGITAMSAFASVTWKTDATGQIVWTTGNIGFRGL